MSAGRIHRTLAISLVSFLAACASVPPDGGLEALMQRSAKTTVGLGSAAISASEINPVIQLPRPGADHSGEITNLLKGPLSAEAAVRVALLNNPGLQFTLGREGINITDMAPAGTAAKLRASQHITRLSVETRKAWLNAVAAAHIAASMMQFKQAAEVSAELARRLVRAGNWSQLQQARQQVVLAEAAVELARAQQAAFSTREKLILLLGLSGDLTQFVLSTAPPELPALPEKARELPDIERLALQAREDLQLATLAWQREENERRISRPGQLWEASGDAAQLRELAVTARSQARVTYQRYRSSFDIARHLQDEMLPLRQFISDEMQLRYNGMLSSVFDVLADARAQALGVKAAIEARRDFWLAETDLQSLLAGVPLEPLNDAAAPTQGPRPTARH
jgi:multidrug efflux system outer membrane protein